MASHGSLQSEEAGSDGTVAGEETASDTGSVTSKEGSVNRGTSGSGIVIGDERSSENSVCCMYW